jgi:hypothetical protein
MSAVVTINILQLFSTEVINSTEQSFPWEGDSRSASQKFPAFNRTWTFIIVFARAHHWTLFSAHIIIYHLFKIHFKINLHLRL